MVFVAGITPALFTRTSSEPKRSRVAAIQASTYAAEENIQTHGGMGFTWEFDCHLYVRRAKLLSLAIGSEAVWQDRLVSSLAAQSAAA